ncbi:MAG: hypothetical protein IT198_14745 [Acidimicrobiia bacterium]|nr:hypothetical protein [Acidimicrobiia bacterium]
MESFLAAVGGVVAGAGIGILLLYLAWRLFLREWVARRRQQGTDPRRPLDRG